MKDTRTELEKETEWTELFIPKDCVSILIGMDMDAVRHWEAVKKRAPVILHKPTDAIPVIIGYVPDSEDHRVWDTLDPPTLARQM